MAKTKAAATFSIIQKRLDERPELTKKYGDNALPLLGLSLFVQAEDIDALAAESLTDGGNDKKINFCFIDRTTKYAAVVQGFCAGQSHQIPQPLCGWVVTQIATGSP